MFEDQLTVVLEERVPVFSFTFGVPDEVRLSALKEAGILTLGTATTVREALVLEERNVDAIVGQGSEAGGIAGRLSATSKAPASARWPSFRSSPTS